MYFILSLVIIVLLVLYYQGHIGSIFSGARRKRVPKSVVRTEFANTSDLTLAGALSSAEGEGYREALQQLRALNEEHLRSPNLDEARLLRAFCCLMLITSKVEIAERSSLLEEAGKALDGLTEVAEELTVARYLRARLLMIAESTDQAIPLLKALLANVDSIPKKHFLGTAIVIIATHYIDQGNSYSARMYWKKLGNNSDVLEDEAPQQMRRILLESTSETTTTSNNAEIFELAIIALHEKHVQSEGSLSVLQHAVRARAALVDHRDDLVFSHCEWFFERYRAEPDDLADDAVADVLDPNLSSEFQSQSELPPELYVQFAMIQATAITSQTAQSHIQLDPSVVNSMTRPLIQALRVVPGHPLLLGCLSFLYLFFRDEHQHRARACLRALRPFLEGTGSAASFVFEKESSKEAERLKRLEEFRTVSSVYLEDATISLDLREHMLEELSRYKDFGPTLVDLSELPPLALEQPSIDSLEERGLQIKEFVNRARSDIPARQVKELADLASLYHAEIEKLKSVRSRLEQLESELFVRVGNALMAVGGEDD